MLSARDQGRGESAMPEQPDRARGKRVQARSHSAAAYRFCPARTSSAGSGNMSSRRACYLGNFDRSSQNLGVRLFVSWCQTTKQKILQLTGMTKQKTKSNKKQNSRLQTWKWLCWKPLMFCWKWLILLKLITIRVLTNQNISKILSLLFHIPFNNYTSCL